MRTVLRALLAVTSVSLAAACTPASGAASAPKTPGGAPPAGRTTTRAPESAPPSAAMRAVLAAHNALRRKHCSPPLTWSRKLAKAAQRWADHLALRGCGLWHSHGRYGENLAAGTLGALTPTGVVRFWYGEREGYDFRRGGFSMGTGHFTQVVWRATRRLGCGRTVCGPSDLWVCEYDPPGNVAGGYRQNVLPTSCRR